MDEELYRPPRAPLTVPAPGLEDDLIAFVGPNADRYLSQWSGLVEARSSFAGFNWSAFLAYVLWFVYRRMYLEACVLVSFSIGLGVLESFIATTGVLSPATVSVLGGASSLAFYVAVGFAANPWYYHRAQRLLQKNATSVAGSDRAERVSSLGGVNAGAVWIAAIGFFVAGFVVTMLAASRSAA